MVFDFLFRHKKPELPFKTDIHCHIIPGVDDGSPDSETSAALLAQMRELGFQRVFASPHVTQDTFENTPENLACPTEELRAEIQRQGLDIELHRHAEYRLDDFLLRQLKAGNITPMPGEYLLVENSFSQEP